MTNAFNLSQLANNTNSSGQVSLTTGVTGTISSSNISPVTGTGNVVLSISPTFTGTPLSTTAASGTNTTQIATTAFAYGTLSAATVGYTKLANGFIIQWGFMTGQSTNPTLKTFPITFPTACISFASNFNANQIGTYDAGYQALRSGYPTTTQFQFVYDTGRLWIAIGY